MKTHNQGFVSIHKQGGVIPGKNNPPGEIPDNTEKLFFTLAYPATREQYEAAFEKIIAIKKYVRITGMFSFDIAKWLSETFTEQAEIESSAADPESIRQFFRAVLPRSEFEKISAGSLSLITRIKALKGSAPGSLLNWLIRQLDALDLPDRIKESLFHNLQINLLWDVGPGTCQNLLLSKRSTKPFLHRSLVRKPVLRRLLLQKLPAPEETSAKLKKQLINTARAVLALLYRETEPFSYADTREITRFELERGLTVVLYGMDPERRLSIESYIGYLAFKNGIPVAYGGGWIFGSRCQFGINILPAFRGGESSLLFYQLLRVYRQHFNTTRFIVKPYQFGKNNPEAIASGAFWFYYKAGFRAENDELQKLAAAEWKKKKTVVGYRTPPAVLKQFTVAPMALDISAGQNPKIDAADISKKITEHINKQYDGDRQKAMAACLQKTKRVLGLPHFTGWNHYERHAFREWSLLVQAVLKPGDWKASDRRKLLGIIKTKGSSPERSFIRQLQQHQQFWNDLSTILR